MSPNFKTSIARLLSHEGGFTDSSNDPGNWTGGRIGVGVCKGTKYGIAANTYGHLDIKNLTWNQAVEIYHRDYWEAAQLDRQPAGVAFQLLDAAINSGIGNASRFLQRAARVADDGNIGPATLAAALSMDPNDLLMRFISARLRFMTGLKNWSAAGKGWARRMADNLDYAAEDN